MGVLVGALVALLAAELVALPAARGLPGAVLPRGVPLRAARVGLWSVGVLALVLLAAAGGDRARPAVVGRLRLAAAGDQARPPVVRRLRFAAAGGRARRALARPVDGRAGDGLNRPTATMI